MGRIWTELECLEVWKTSKMDIKDLIEKINRSYGALCAAWRAKDMTISKKHDLFYRPASSNPERYFLKFVSQNIKPIE